MTRAYLDHASTSPCRPAATDAMVEWLRSGVVAADPGRIHHEGRVVRVALEEARETIASFFGCRPRSVVLTSGATESIAAATWGAVQASDGPIVAAGVEHSSILESARRHGRLHTVAVDGVGRIDIDAVAAALKAEPRPALVHVQSANHEVGTIQPVSEVVALCREAGVLVHADAAAAAGHLPLRFDDCGVDLLSLSAHKFGGPAGVGALLVRRGLRIEPLLVGGAQERARRGGLENVVGAVGLAAACRELGEGDRLDAEAERSRAQLARVRDAALSIHGVTSFGDPDPARRLPHIACLAVEHVEAEPILLALDQAGVAVHSGSSCSSEMLEPSPVLAAMGVDSEHSLRVSVGWSTTEAEIDRFVAAFPEAVGRLQSLRTR